MTTNKINAVFVFVFFFSFRQLIFKDVMLLQFVNVFLQALVYRSHDLLQEEITITLYNMAAVDFDSFYSAFLPRFLGGCEGLTESQKSELGKNFTPDKVSTTRENMDLHKVPVKCKYLENSPKKARLSADWLKIVFV